MAGLNKVVIMAGGTGGHIFPGLAIAEALRAQGVAVHWLGSQNGMETQIVPAAHIPLTTLTINGWRGKSLLQQCAIPWRLCQAVLQAYRFLKHLKPQVVIGMGGFAAAPGGIAAKLLGIPLIIHEQNRIAGMTNRYLAKIAHRVLCAFPDTFAAQAKMSVTGNPVRADIAALPAPTIRYAQPHTPLRLLILGGSRGAKALNETVPAAIALLPENLRPEICHQTGAALSAATQARYAEFSLAADVLPFIDNMAQRYAWADMVICRAGASTVTEIMAAGLPAIFIPYPHAVDDHQTANARYLAERQAGVLLPQAQLTAESLGSALRSLLENPALRVQMAQQAYALRRIDTVSEIVKIIPLYTTKNKLMGE